jgi:hypothetical protein
LTAICELYVLLYGGYELLVGLILFLVSFIWKHA